MEFDNAKQELYYKGKEFCRNYFIILSLIFASFFILIVMSKEVAFYLKEVKIYHFCFTFICTFLAYINDKIEYNFVFYIKQISVFNFFAILFITIHTYKLSLYPYLYYIPFLFIIYIITSKKNIIYISLFYLSVCLLTPKISNLLNIVAVQNPTGKAPTFIQLTPICYILDIYTLVICIVLTTFAVIYKRKFRRIELKLQTTCKSPNSELSYSDIIENYENEKFEKIYNEIIHLLEIEKLYQNPELSKHQLAEKLKTNETYISKAINQKGKINFNTLINRYRINQVQTEFLKKNHEIYTIEHIYTKAGFNQQSTFNRVFKEFVGKTPSEYIDELES